MYLFRNALLIMITVLACLPNASGFCEEPKQTPIVPQTLLKLIHAPEVQEEFGLQPDDEALLAVLPEIDATWLSNRNQPEEKQHETVSELEMQLLKELKSLVKEDKIKRLREIEVQSQGTRSFLRPRS